jgi:hypothetical protein
LTIRQALGQATLRIPTDIDKTKLRNHIVHICGTTLRPLVPATPDEKLLAFAEKVFDKAISLKNAMTQEQAIYRCFMAVSGQTFQEAWQKVAEGERVGGMVLMCTHPTLCRVNLQDGGGYMSIVKASVKLEDPVEEKQNGDECDELQDEKEFAELLRGVVG